MIVSVACVAAVLIVLLRFKAIRRSLQRVIFSVSTRDLPIGTTLDKHVFVFQGDGVRKDSANTTSLRQAASFRKPWVAGQSYVGTHVQRLRWQRSFRPRSSSISPSCHATSSTKYGVQQAADSQPLHDADQFSCAPGLLPLAVIVTDPTGKIIFANSAAGELFGYSVDELIGSNATQLGAGVKPPASIANRETSASGFDWANDTRLREAVAIRRDGSEFPVEISVNQVHASTQQYSLSIIMDRTERNELMRHRQQLAHLARVSTLGELAGSLAHELNQPLTAILSNAQAAQRFMTMEPVNRVEVDEILHDLVQDTHRASEVIRKIRALVKKGEIELAPVSVANVIRDVALLVHSDAIVRGIRVVVIAAPALPPIQADKVQLQQVILNLLLNAFDAMEGGAFPERMVAIRSSVDATGEIRVSVQDHGTGISPDRISRLFMPFFTSKRDGLGLGLSISRSIVEMHGGRIWAENNKDRGATFYFTLPARALTENAISRVMP